MLSTSTLQGPTQTKGIAVDLRLTWEFMKWHLPVEWMDKHQGDLYSRAASGSVKFRVKRAGGGTREVRVLDLFREHLAAEGIHGLNDHYLQVLLSDVLIKRHKGTLARHLGGEL